jgi:hypothetical protein
MKKLILITSMALSALFLGTPVGAKDQVTRPMKWLGQNVIAVDFSTWTWWVEEVSGQGTHVGSYTCEGGGFFTATGIVGHGSLIAANGDRIFFEMSREGDQPAIFTITRGTGRFENATGLWTGVSTEIGQWTDEDGLLHISHISQGTGSLTY